jgi:hypothetical protein
VVELRAYGSVALPFRMPGDVAGEGTWLFTSTLLLSLPIGWP